MNVGMALGCFREESGLSIASASMGIISFRQESIYLDLMNYLVGMLRDGGGYLLT